MRRRHVATHPVRAAAWLVALGAGALVIAAPAYAELTTDAAQCQGEVVITGDDGTDTTITQDTEQVPWSEAKRIVQDAYGTFSDTLGGIIDDFLTKPWIDGPVRPGKRGGAFCSYAVPSVHPYVLLNYTHLRRDVLTLAHELGHGVHAALGMGERPGREPGQHVPRAPVHAAAAFSRLCRAERLARDALP